jgi:ABC-2 type transport system ATP-binding protein
LATLLFVGALAACSSSAPKSDAPTSSSSTTPSRATPAACSPPAAPASVVTTKVTGVASDWDLSSFDGTKIRLHWFPAPRASAARRAPTVFMGPGWGLAGDTNTSGAAIFGAASIGSLWQSGYNVLTWDPRGFGQSGGTVEVDSAQFEGRDVQRLIDWVATQPVAQRDGRNDPRMGMVGGSYGGGIQLIAASLDCRIDAIVPEVAWHSLTTSLYKANTPKNGWSEILVGLTRGRSVDPHIPHAYEASITTGVIDQDDRTWFAQRGPGDLVARIATPTLIVQGTVDNLFTLDEGIQNYRILRDRGVPTAMVWFCGGHGACLTDPGPDRVRSAVVHWLDRYVKRDTTIETGPRFAFVDQNGTRYTADDYPLPAGQPVTADGRGTLHLLADGGSGPAQLPADNTNVVASVAAAVTPARAKNAVNVHLDFASPGVVVGAPQLRFSYHGTTPTGNKPTRVFAQLVDDATGIVLGNQITPIEVTLDGGTHQVSVPLEVVAFTGRAGAHVTLQLVATTVAYAQPRLGGTIQFGEIHVSLPIAKDLRVE